MMIDTSRKQTILLVYIFETFEQILSAVHLLTWKVFFIGISEQKQKFLNT